ncbi:MAG TPA: ABC transporter permease [Pyrinomonadaceae bacterium]
MRSLVQDLRFGARVLRKRPGFTAVAVVALALGIGANTAIFSVVEAVLLRPLPYERPEQLVWMYEDGRDVPNRWVSYPNFLDWRARGRSFEAMSATRGWATTLTGDGGPPESLDARMVSAEYFDVMRARPLIGRAFLREEDGPGAARVVVLSHGFWQRRFGGDEKIVGKSVTLEDRPFTVVGVMPPDFRHQGPPPVWVLMGQWTDEKGWMERDVRIAGNVVARLKEGVGVEQARADMAAVKEALTRESPYTNAGHVIRVVPLRESMVGESRTPLLLMFGAVGFVLLIACANVANLLLARAAAREKEIALRAALGAQRLRIVRQLLTESVLLAVLGSLLGLVFAWWGMGALVAISPRDLVNLHGVGLNLTVLAWTLAVSLVTGIIFGLAPALEATRLNLNDALKEGGKGAGGQGSTRSRRLRNALVVAEVALALVLLASAGLLVKSFVRLQKIDTGFNTENVLTMVVRLPDSKYKEDPQFVAFFRQAMERIRTLPGVRAVGMVNYLPLYGGLGSATGFTIEGRPAPPPGEEPSTNVRVTDADYFSAMGIPLLRGRNFTDLETSEARRVILISESLAQQHFPGEEPLGKRLSVGMFDKPVLTEIIGIVGDVKYDSLTDRAEPTVYFPHSELTYAFMTLVIRTDGDPALMAPAVERELRAIDPDQPVSDVRTMNQVMADTTGRARFNTLLLALFAGLATLLAAVGIFGVMNYSVALRTHEIGIRMALGAQPGRILMLILKQGLLLTLIGIGIGLVGALALTRVMSGLLFGVGATDPVTFAAIVLLLAVVSLIACYIPARRATRVDPLIALRYE